MQSTRGCWKAAPRQRRFSMSKSRASGGALDIAANRVGRKYSRGEMTRRVLWEFGRYLFKLSPRPFFAWRRVLLRAFGARVGRHVHVYASAVVFMPWNLDIGDWSAIGESAYIYNLGAVRIGRAVTVSQRAHLCAGTHDYTSADMTLLRPGIVIEDQAWVCADAFVGPGVTVGEGAVLGARAVAVRDVPAWKIAVGNPARPIKDRMLSERAR